VERGIACIKRDRCRTEIEVGGHLLMADAPLWLGGAHEGPTPHELLLASLGACTAMTLRRYAAHRHWPLESLDVFLQIVRAGNDVHIERQLAMQGVGQAQKIALLRLAEETPLTILVRRGLPIRTSLA
jgi:putative redox protein